MVSIREEAAYKNFGKCLSISNESMEILVTVDVGPRIIRCSLTGGENLMYEDIERHTVQDVSSLYGEGKTWNIYGGHRLWLSPESMPETYYPDNEKVVYTIKSQGAEFTPPQQEKTGLQYSIRIEMDSDAPKLKITHTIANTQKNPITGAAWALTVLGADGAVIVPQPKEETGLLANRVLAVWPYTDMTDPRIFWGRDHIALRQNPEMSKPIKFGINNTAGKIAYVNHSQALVKEYRHAAGKSYPDYGVSCEVYASGYFTEAETLSPLTIMKKGEQIVHEESWTLYGDVSIGEFSNESLSELTEKIF